jgi:hypothetical protein
MIRKVSIPAIVALVMAAVLSLPQGTATAQTPSWATLAGIPTARAQASVATDSSGKIHVIGGYTPTLLASHQVYDPASDTWSTAAAIPGATRAAGIAVGPDGDIYVFGGYRSGQLSSIYRYDPDTNTWTSGSSMPFPAGWETAGEFGSDGKLYVFGGEGAQTKLQIYDPAGNSWSLGTNLPSGRLQHGAFRGSDGRFYIVGGRYGADTNLIYDPSTNLWSTGPSLPTGASSFGQATTPARDSFYVIGGSNTYGNLQSPYFNTVFVFDVALQSWTTFTPSLPTARRELSAAYSATDGSIHVLGGSNPGILSTHEALAVAALATNEVPVVNAGADAIIDEGDTFSQSGSFTDPDADTWSATVDYKEGAGAQTLAPAGKSFALSNLYEQNGV